MPNKDSASARIKQIFNEQSLFLERMHEIPYIRRMNLSPEETARRERNWHVGNWVRCDKFKNEKGELVRTFSNVSLPPPGRDFDHTVVDVIEDRQGNFSFHEISWREMEDRRNARRNKP